MKKVIMLLLSLPDPKKAESSDEETTKTLFNFMMVTPFFYQICVPRTRFLRFCDDS
jgi:hypothetical protein